MDTKTYKTKEEVRDDLIKLINNFIGNKKEAKDFKGNEDLFNDFGFDSLDFVGLQIEIEKKFGIETYSLELPEPIKKIDRIVSKICELKKIEL